MTRTIGKLAATLGALFWTGAAFAQPQAGVASLEMGLTDTGDTSWVLTASALVLMMTLPGLALFYGGLVRSKNFLSVLIQCGAVAAASSVLWIVMGYSLAFSVDGSDFIGSPSNFMFADLIAVREGQSTGELVFALFQMTFAIITPALMIGAWVERARFGWVMAFTTLWSLVVYIPVARWIWGGGFLADWGVIDFAGGIVVHTTAGVSALVVALMMGKRAGWPKSPLLPHSPALTMVGMALLWVGWFGFNGGSALGANDTGAASAIINTHFAASAAALLWIVIDKIKVGKSTAVGFATGAIAGLATITPAAGTVSTGGAVLIGLAGCGLCYFFVNLIKLKLQIDDSLDVFAVHGVGGIAGSILVAIFTSSALNGAGYVEGTTMGSQLLVQLGGIGIVALWSIFATVILGYMVSIFIPMRVSPDAEREGLDITSHGERAWEMD